MLDAYAGISSAFEVSARADPKALADGSVLALPIVPSYVKSHDEDVVQRAASTSDVAGWGFFLAREGDVVAGACAVSRALVSRYFESGPDAALLWDIRVSPPYRGRGVGKALVDGAAAWARDSGCDELLIETQDTNLAACRLYLSAGCIVRSIVPGAYLEYPDDILIVFSLALS
jgi:GNAT superfamily N-acetyltransferase